MPRIYNENIIGKLAAYFKSRLGMFDYKNGWLKGPCPHCGKEDKFGVQLRDGRTNCFVCTENMNPIDTIAYIEGFDKRHEVYNHLRTFKDAVYLEPKVEIYKQRQVILPEDFRLLSFGKSQFSKLAQQYMKRRGFDIDDLAMRGIGYCLKGDKGGYIIFPFYQKGKLIYYTTRRFINTGPKFKNPNIEDFGIGKSSIIYNIDALAIYNKIRICESITNALTLDDKSVAIDGKIISAYQLSVIIRSPIKSVEILLDRDAYSDAIKMGLKIAYHKRVKLVRMPTNEDINDIGKKETLKIIKASPWQSYRDIYKEHLNYGKRA